MEFNIKWYSTRNQKMHSGINQYIRTCNWNGLGARLLEDLKDIPHLFGETDRDQNASRPRSSQKTLL